MSVLDVLIQRQKIKTSNESNAQGGVEIQLKGLLGLALMYVRWKNKHVLRLIFSLSTMWKTQSLTEMCARHISWGLKAAGA